MPRGGERLEEKLYSAIYKGVVEAVEELKELSHHVDEVDTIKKITRYINKPACNPDVHGLPWKEALQKIVDGAMASFHASMAEKEWFFDIQLAPVFSQALCIVMAETQPHTRVDQRAVDSEAFLAYSDKVERALLDKAMWDVTSTWGDHKVRARVFHALSKSYWKAMDVALLEGGKSIFDLSRASPRQEMANVETFTRKWIEDAINRCWSIMENAENAFSREVVIVLFTTLVTPFGEENPFTCIPPKFTQRIGRPPTDWPYIPKVVNELFREWNRHAAARSKKRKSASEPQEEEAEERQAPKGAPVDVFTRRKKPHTAKEEPKGEPDEDEVEVMEEEMVEEELEGEALPEEEEVEDPDASEEDMEAPAEEEPDWLEEEEPPARKEARERIKPQAKQAAAARGRGAGIKPREPRMPPALMPQDPEGHPDCTSAEECIGHPQLRLVRHIIEGGGDRYCEACWESFTRRNPSLEGEIDDD